jgi:AbrB family looped-hinge helix DNA binding protein
MLSVKCVISMKSPPSTIRMKPHDITVYGTVKVGERGQIVVPSDARKEFDIKPGDFLLVVGTPMRDGIALIKAEAVEEMIGKLTSGLTRLGDKGGRSPSKK